MSTVHERRIPPPPPDDPFFYGWRDVYRKDEHGRRVHEQIPLTREDVLHPQEGDHVMNGSPHDEDCIYLTNVCKARISGRSDAAVLHDVGVYWDDAALGHHSPDVTVLFDLRQVLRWQTFHVAEEGVRPTLLFEVTSYSTRDIDLRDKKRAYYQAGVPFYIIVDDEARRGRPRRLRLLGYRHGRRGYQRMRLSSDGRLWLEPLGIWLALEGGRVVCYNVAGERLLEYAEVEQARVNAEQALISAEQARLAAEQARLAAERQAQVEAEGRIAAEAKLREMAAELKRLRGEK